MYSIISYCISRLSCSNNTDSCHNNTGYVRTDTTYSKQITNIIIS